LFVIFKTYLIIPANCCIRRIAASPSTIGCFGATPAAIEATPTDSLIVDLVLIVNDSDKVL
jgi:hypothetical protein